MTSPEMAAQAPTANPPYTGLYLLLMFSTSIYFSALVVSASEFKYAQMMYYKMCQFDACWPAHFQVWAVAIAFSVLSLVASAFLSWVYASRRPKPNPLVTRVLLVSMLAMWLVVIVLGWTPSQISLYPSSNGIPETDRSGTSYSRSWASDDPEPHSGMFHYAVAFYQATVASPLSTMAYHDIIEQGKMAMAAVFFCNFAL